MNYDAGMSVKIGNLIDGRKTIAGGAPRSKGHGQVILFELESTTSTILQKVYLNGEQIGSGFGYDMAVGDFNGDGLI
jgi:integrin alpha 7